MLKLNNTVHVIGLYYFRVGPLHGGRQYDVLAEKPGYVLVKEDGEMAVFFAYKLGEISVQVSYHSGG